MGLGKTLQTIMLIMTNPAPAGWAVRNYSEAGSEQFCLLEMFAFILWKTLEVIYSPLDDIQIVKITVMGMPN